MNDCNDCVYSNKTGCPNGTIKCEYPVPIWVSMSGSHYVNAFHGINCPLIKLKMEDNDDND